jgi:hypothetical protein
MVGSSISSSSLGGTRAGPDATKDAQVLLLQSTTVKKAKHLAPQDAIDEFWAKFNSKTPGKGEFETIAR